MVIGLMVRTVVLVVNWAKSCWEIIMIRDGEFLCMMIIRYLKCSFLEGAQAGLSWETVLKKQQGYRKAFYNFDPSKVATMRDTEMEALLKNEEIIRNRLKIFSIRQNAKVFLNIQQEFGSFDHYVWNFVNNKPIVGHWKR